eukprot:1150842-Pelagomonas_calceolata.AAC.12
MHESLQVPAHASMRVSKPESASTRASECQHESASACQHASAPFPGVLSSGRLMHNERMGALSSLCTGHAAHRWPGGAQVVTWYPPHS